MIHLGPERKWFFMEQIRSDAEVGSRWPLPLLTASCPVLNSGAVSLDAQFLEKLGIMDYSLLLGIHVLDVTDMASAASSIVAGDSGSTGGHLGPCTCSVSVSGGGVSGGAAAMSPGPGSVGCSAVMCRSRSGVRLPTAQEYRLPTRLKPGQAGCAFPMALCAEALFSFLARCSHRPLLSTLCLTCRCRR
jgi:hypothetical protein